MDTKTPWRSPRQFQPGDQRCSEPNCTAFYRTHSWGSIKAQQAGWFKGREDDVCWCPDHLPAWVGPWRERQKAKKDAQKNAD